MNATTATAYRRDHDTDRIDRNRRQVRRWLGFVLFTLFVLVLVGGATRLTDSGLSITEWKPIHGAIPPLTAAEWQEEFDLYKRIPQYEQINKGMTVDEFKTIFWWEWAHRLIARSIGFVFAVPRPGDGPLSTPQGSATANLVVQGAAWAILLVLVAPLVALAVLAMRGGDVAGWALVVVGPALGAAVVAAGLRWGAKLYDAGVPELMQRLRMVG